IENVHAHVIGIGPDSQLGIIKEVGAKVEAITEVTPGCIAGGRNSNTFVSGDTYTGELTDDPTVGDLVIKHHGVASAVGRADAAKAAPKSADANRSKDGRACALVENLEPFVHDLNILRQTDL